MKKSKQFLHICLHLLLEPTGLLHKKQTIDSYSRLWLNMSRSKTIQIILFPSKGIEVLYYIYIYTSLSVSKLKYIWIILCIEDVSFRWSESILAMEVLRQMCYIDQRSYKLMKPMLWSSCHSFWAFHSRVYVLSTSFVFLEEQSTTSRWEVEVPAEFIS